MKDRETNLLDLWHNERPMYEAWGVFVSDTLKEIVSKQVNPTEVDLFFRLPLKHRTKEDTSLLAKAFHRGKPYADPYVDIEDKVGVRVVVLFSEEIRFVERLIQECEFWSAKKSRDFEDERMARPFEFDYQALHYIVRAKDTFQHNSVNILAGTPCEIQIRTILQHAYSELTHDTLYKPSIQAEPDVKRAAAKSMALIEATDDYFAQVREKIERAQAPVRRVTEFAEEAYRDFTKLIPQLSPLNTLLIDHFSQWTKNGFEEDLVSFLNEKPYLADRIRERSSELIYRQPAVILIYWSIKQAARQVPVNAPLSNEELAPFYSDLGMRLPESIA